MNIIPGWLKDIWTSREEKQRIREHHVDQLSMLYLAIEQRNVSAIHDIMAQAKRPDLLVDDHYSKLIRSALLTDDLDTFNAVFNLAKDPSPNFVIIEHTPYLPGNEEESLLKTPLITAAIYKGAENIAMSLANNPETDIYATASKSHTISRSDGLYGHGEISELPRMIALEHGMEDVAEVLEQRETDDLKSRAIPLHKRTA